MKVTIQLLGQARRLAARERLELEIPAESTVHDLLPAILKGADERLNSLLACEGKLRRSVMAILRDETIDPAASGLLQDGDELSLLPPMSGG